MKPIDFYKKKRKLHDEMIAAICKILDKFGVNEIDFENAGIDGGYACLSIDGPAEEVRVLRLRKTGENCLEFIPEGLGYLNYDNRWRNMERDVLYASIDTVYEAVYDMFYKK